MSEVINTQSEQNQVHSSIKAKFDNKVDIRPCKFFFKTKDGVRRPTVELDIPVPSIEGIISILEKGDTPSVQLLLDAVAEVVLTQAREQVDENENISQDTLKLETLSWEAIANMPKAARRGSGISKEIWEDFKKDYVLVMPDLAAIEVERAEKAAELFLNKLVAVRTRKPALLKLQAYLTLYATKAARAEDFADVIAFLSNKLDVYLKADDEELLAAL